MKNLFVKFIFILVLLPVTSIAQNILDDFKKLNRHYLELGSYSMNFNVRYTVTGASDLVVQQGSVVHTNDLHFTRIGENITLINKNEFVAVNESTRLLVYNKTENYQKPEEVSTMDIGTMLDSLWKNQEHLNCKYIDAPKGKLRVFVEDQKNEHFNAYSITIDAQKFNLLEFVYYVRPETGNNVDKIIITYSNETAKPKTGRSEYRIGYYVSTVAGSVKPTELYKDYEFIDQSKTTIYGN